MSEKKKKHNLEMDFRSLETVEGNTIEEKLHTILEDVKEGRIVVLDEALSADEEAQLVTATMEGIGEEFTGIEFCSLPRKGSVLGELVHKFIEKVTKKPSSRPGITFIGPSTVIKEIKRDPEAFTVSAEI